METEFAIQPITKQDNLTGLLSESVKRTLRQASSFLEVRDEPWEGFQDETTLVNVKSPLRR